MTFVEILLLLGTGLFAGLLGGLFGIGGGVVIVPALFALFSAQGIPEEYRIKLAVGTSLATIIITSMSSLRAHHRHGHVLWSVLKRWAPLIAVGAIAGAALAGVVPAQGLTTFFAVAMAALGIQRFLGGGGAVAALPADEGAPQKPSVWEAPSAGMTGLVSSLLGIGGGILGVLILTRMGTAVHRAIGTAAGFGLVIAIPGALSYMLLGSLAGDAPGLWWGKGNAGFVSLPAFAAVALGTSFAAPVGATFAARLPAKMLNRLFGSYLIVTATGMLVEALRGV